MSCTFWRPFSRCSRSLRARWRSRCRRSPKASRRTRPPSCWSISRPISFRPTAPGTASSPNTTRRPACSTASSSSSARRAKGVLVVHITEGYTSDYRELDASNPGMFHRGQIGRGAWKVGSKEAAYYEPLKPAPEDRDLFLPPRSQVSGFGGTGLSEILRAKGIKNVAVAGFTSDVCVYATALSAYDLGFHVYALREGMVGFFDGMAEQMVNFVYPMWSQVIDNDEFDNMIEASPGASRKASAN